jgi:hypothetical protein
VQQRFANHTEYSHIGLLSNRNLDILSTDEVLCVSGKQANHDLNLARSSGNGLVRRISAEGKGSLARG